MRFGLSAAAAGSGLLLLGLALFGQPDVYLRQARAVWDDLNDPAPPAPEIPRMAIEPAPAAPEAATLAPEPAPREAANQPGAAVTTKVEQLQQQVLQLRDELAARREEADRTREALAVAQAQRQAAEAQRQAAAQASTIAPEPQVNSVQNSSETPAVDRHALGSKPVAPPAKPSPRQESENAQSVLARLRQAAPVTPAREDTVQPPGRISRGPSPALRRLIAARSALANGQIEETRRLLQEAQLQLVFRPVGSADAETGSSSRTASDVARALEALSGNDMALSRSFLDRAVSASSGPPADLARGETGGLPPANVPGYAPAYPVR